MSEPAPVLPLWRKLAALAFFAGGVALLVVVAAMAKCGGVVVVKGLFYADHPFQNLFMGLFCLIVGHLLWHGPRMTPKDRFVFFARLILLGFSLGIAVLVAEVAFRAYLMKKLDAGSFEQFKKMKSEGRDIQVHSASPLAKIIVPSANSTLIYELQPGLNMEFGHKPLRTTTAGMRQDAEVPVVRTPGTVRIMGIGDSGMFGWDVDQGHSYMDVMRDTLNARGDGVKVESLNTGTPGYNTQLEVELLRYKGLAYKPDIVIVGWCENDFFLPHFFLKKQPLPKRRLLLADLIFDREKFRDELTGQSIGDRENTKGSDGKVDLEQVPDSVKTGMFAEGVTKAMEQLRDLGKEHGFKVLVFGPMKDEVRAIVKKVGLDYCSTLEKIGEKQYPPEWAVHQMHPRIEGHKVLGELLAKELADRGWLKPQS